MERLEAFLDRLGTQTDVYTAAAAKAIKGDLRAVLAELKQLRPEYGIRADWINTLSSEGPVAETLGDALKRLDEFDAMHGDRVVSRELVVRSVSGWRELRTDGEQQPEGDDHGQR